MAKPNGTNNLQTSTLTNSWKRRQNCTNFWCHMAGFAKQFFKEMVFRFWTLDSGHTQKILWSIWNSINLGKLIVKDKDYTMHFCKKVFKGDRSKRCRLISHFSFLIGKENIRFRVLPNKILVLLSIFCLFPCWIHIREFDIYSFFSFKLHNSILYSLC